MITVQLPDGRTINVDTTDPQAAASAARQFLASEGKAAPPQPAQPAEPRPAKPPPAPQHAKGDNALGNAMGFMANFNRGTVGLDEGGAALSTIYDLATGASPIHADTAIGDVKNAFAKRMARGRQIEDDFAARHRAASNVAKGLGMSATFLVPAAKAVQGVPALMNVARAGTTAALEGDIYGLMDRGTPRERARAGAFNAAVAGPLGGAVGALASRTPRTARPISQTAQNVQAMDRAGVRPSLVAARGGEDAPVTKAIGENWLAGVRVRRNLRGSLDDTAASAQRMAGQYGQPMTREAAGEASRAAIERFASGETASGRMTFSQRSGQLYDDAFGEIDTALAGRQDPRSLATKAGTTAKQRSWANPMQKTVPARAPQTVLTGGSEIATPAATAELDHMINSVQSKPIADLIVDPTLKRVAGALKTGGKDMSFSDLRRLRTWVREAQNNQELRQNIGAANLQRLEGALTQDIYTNVERLGSPTTLLKLRRADQYYAAGSRQIADKLSAVFKAKSDENAYDLVIRAAKDEAGGDLKRLTALKRAMTPDEWGDVAATAVARLGKVKPGAANAAEDGAFSVANFVTNYAALSPAGRQTLFGSRAGGGARASALKHELDNLIYVAGLQKGVEAAANASKSGVSLQNIGSILALLNPHTTAPTAAGLGGAAVLGEALTNPAFVRWLAKAPKAVSPAARAAHLQDLARLAKANPRLVGIYNQLNAPPASASAASAAPN